MLSSFCLKFVGVLLLDPMDMEKIKPKIAKLADKYRLSLVLLFKRPSGAPGRGTVGSKIIRLTRFCQWLILSLKPGGLVIFPGLPGGREKIYFNLMRYDII